MPLTNKSPPSRLHMELWILPFSQAVEINLFSRWIYCAKDSFIALWNGVFWEGAAPLNTLFHLVFLFAVFLLAKSLCLSLDWELYYLRCCLKWHNTESQVTYEILKRNRLFQSKWNLLLEKWVPFSLCVYSDEFLRYFSAVHHVTKLSAA